MRVLWVLLFAGCAEAASRSDFSPFSTGSQSPIPLIESSSSSSSDGSDTTSDSTSEMGVGTSTSGTSGTSGEPFHEGGSSTEGGSMSSSSGGTSGGEDAMTTSGSSETSEGSTGASEEQPIAGLFSDCLYPGDCVEPKTDGCFAIADEVTMMLVDGFCTNLCQEDSDCGFMLGAACTQVGINPPQSVCAIACTDTKECLDGMICTQVEPAGLICV